MKNLLVLLMLALAISSCEKETSDIVPDVTMDSATIITLMDTLHTGNHKSFYSIPITGNSYDHVIINSKQAMGSTAEIYQFTIYSDNSEIAFIEKHDTTWYVYAPPDTSFYYHTYHQVVNLNQFDTVRQTMDFSSSELIINQYLNEGPSYLNNTPYQCFERYDLIGIAPFYIAVRTSSEYAWIKLEVLNRYTMVVHSYHTSNNLDDLIIKE